MHDGSTVVRRVQSRGQVTIPEQIREQCGIDPGADLLFVPIGPNRFECQRLPIGDSLLEFIDAMSGDGSAPDIDSLRKQMGDEIATRVLRK